MADKLTLAPGARHAFDRLAQDVVRVFGPRFVALVASGTHSSVAFTSEILPGDLEALGALRDTWRHDKLDTPLFLTPHEFRRSLDAFPLEYQAIVDRHAVIAGEPPFVDLVFDPQQVRRACEVQAKSHLIHLRQGWVEAAGHEAELITLIRRSAGPLRALLVNVGRLGPAVSGDGDLATIGARIAGLDGTLVHEILAVETTPDSARHLVRRLPEYIAVTERLWAFVDGWAA
ncbi:MAG: hypothetical protein ABI634_15495 [Acidobacteriota bacterium]